MDADLGSCDENARVEAVGATDEFVGNALVTTEGSTVEEWVLGRERVVTAYSNP